MFPYIRFTIPSYGLMAVIGSLAAISYLYYRNISDAEHEIGFKQFLVLCVFCIVGCLVGARVLFAITQIPVLILDFSISRLIRICLFGGLVFYGGLFGAVVGCIFFSKRYNYDARYLLDRIVPSFALFHIFGRVGCLFSGCCYGFKLTQQLQIGIVRFNYFPLQAVEAVFELVMFVVLARYQGRKSIFHIYILTYAIYRFFVEFFRGDVQRGIWFGLSTSQWISLAILVVFLLKFVRGKMPGSSDDTQTNSQRKFRI